MKHIKQYENLTEEPQVGYYISAVFSYPDDKKWEKYIAKSIGKLLKIDLNFKEEYHTKYNVSDKIYKQCFENEDYEDKACIKKDKVTNKKYIIMKLKRNNIIEFAPTIEELETKLMAKKYNL